MVKFNMPSRPACPLLPAKKAILWCIAHPLGKLKFWDSIRKIWLVSLQWADAIFYSVYLEWSHKKNFIKTSLIIPKLCLFSWAFWFFTSFSFYQLNGSLAKPTYNHNFLSVTYSHGKGHQQASWSGWSQAAQLHTAAMTGSVRTGVERVFLGLWEQERE